MIAESTQTAVANGDTRTLSFYHTHTHERLTVTFKKDGRYDQAALKKLNHFLRDWRNNEVISMEPRLFDVVWEVQKDAGSTAPIQIISAYRSPETNKMLRSRSSGVAKNSQHKLGRAMDIHLPDVNMAKIREAGLRLQRGGVGFYPTSAKPFVHLDVGNVRHWPRMTRDQLVRLFPDGRTVHIPADGKPLKNYELALADVARNGATARGMSETQIATAHVARRNGGGSGRAGSGLIAKLLFGGGDEDEETTPATPAAVPEPAAPVALAALEDTVPVPVARPSQVASGGMELASAYAPQELSSGPDMIWRSGPSAEAGRAATTYEVPEPRPGGATPAVPASVAAPAIQPGAERPVTASLAPEGDLGEAKLEAMRLLGLLNENQPAAAPAPGAAGHSRIASAHEAVARQAPRPMPDRAEIAEPATPKSAYWPQRSARNRTLVLTHPRAADRLIAKPAAVVPAAFGGNPSMGMRSDLFSGSPVAELRIVSFGPQRTAQLSGTR